MSPGDPEHVAGGLAVCLAIEVASSELYALCAELHSDDAEAFHLWKKMAREEQNHAAQFRLAASAAESLIATIHLDLGWARQMRDRVVDLIARFKREPPSVADALKTAIELEEQLAELHISSVATFASKQHGALFEAMMAADRDHAAGLLKLLRRRTGSGRTLPPGRGP